MNPSLERIVNWLRVSYPTGVPERDYQPLLALMRRRLSPEEMHELGNHLVADGLVPADRVDAERTTLLRRREQLLCHLERQLVGSHIRR